MSYEDYKDGQRLELDVMEGKHTYGGVIQALLRMHHNIEQVGGLFPQEYAELKARYNAPGGKLEGEIQDV